MNYIFDTFHNFLSGMGVQGRDKMTAAQYVTQTWTREQLETSFRSDWIARKAITIPAHDATREWRSWQAEADQIELLEATEDRLQVQLKLQQALTKARLYGGCCMLIGVDGSPEKELDPETIKKDGLKFLHVLAPHQLTVEELVKDLEDPYYGQPTFYILRDETKKFGDVKVHPSRMVRLLGLDTPDPMANSGWGDPMLQVIHDAVNSAGTVAGSIATMISEAKLDVIKIPGLTEIFSTANGTNRLIKRFSEANVAKSVINGIIMDAEEEWQRIGINFAGMPEVLQLYLQIAAGAADIPATRFLGRSPAGLNATGDSDLINYYDRIASDQELRLTPALEKLDKAIQQSALGKFDEDIFYDWRPLWQMDDAQKSTIAKAKADAAKVDADTGLVPFEALAKGRTNQLIEDGTYPGLEAAVEEALVHQEEMIEEGLLGPDGRPLPPDPFGMEGGGGPPKPNGKGFPPKKPNGKAPKSKEAVGDGVGPFGMRSTMEDLEESEESDHSQTSLRDKSLLRDELIDLIDRLIPWDESLHPREEKGRFTFSTGSEPPSRSPWRAGFVSPSVRSGLDLKGATRELGSRQQSRLRLASADINKKVGLENAREVNIIGAWTDGAENSIMSRSDADWNETVLATVMKGHLADQKSVLVFQQQDRGVSVLAQFEATGSLARIHRNLLNDGIENHTIVPHEDGKGATIYVVDMDGSNLAKIDKAAQRYDKAKDNPVYYQTGRAEFIGNLETHDKETGKPLTDRQQRDSARRVYESVIAESTVPQAQAIWENVRDHWGAPTKQEGYALTSMAIMAEYPNIKKNSVRLPDAARLINGRAESIIEAKYGVKSLTHKNRTPESDAYLADVIALELRDSLVSGAAAEDWYDKTMVEAMAIAEQIYPELKGDRTKRFAYICSLAITSQGETVTRSAELADEAYQHYRDTGKYPEDIASKDKNIKNNFRKMNVIIKKHGGDLDKVKDFFDKDMTAAELTAATKVDPGATAVTDIVKGSAYLGPKIGNGYYQNLIGNFQPITMDLWFMRSWGRLTNTGISAGPATKQDKNFANALKEAKEDVPSTYEARLAMAEEIYAQHERDWKKYADEYKSGEREKSDVVLAAERFHIWANGKLQEQPKGSGQRHWMTEVFHAAMKKLEQDHGYKLTPAGAQATWWWPEKVLWEEMGVIPKERDADYVKSLRALAGKKGIKLK